MAEHGLVERVRVPDDRRVVLVRPAEAGREAVSMTESSKRDRMRAVIRRLPANERPIVLEALRSLRRALSAEVETSEGTTGVHHHHYFAEQAT
jgi:DNA-binding MarR family transcriptional regulator